ncbi:MAG: hypothetical protein Kow0022_10020 [Phycisphaerales bacterium]
MLEPVLILTLTLPTQIQFIDATTAAGLDGISATRVALVDLDGDTRPDAVIDRTRVFLNRPNDDGDGVRFVEVDRPNLPPVHAGDCLVFADLDNDGRCDAIVARNVTDKVDPVLPTAWCPGLGDGTFAAAIAIPAALPKTTACIAVGDINLDGLPDLYLGNWYTRYGESLEAYTNDLLIQQRGDDGSVRFERQPLPEDRFTFDEQRDGAGRPTYGALIARLGTADGVPEGGPSILELNYGRRANRLWTLSGSGKSSPIWIDAAPAWHIDGDDIRHGRYPEWLKERARTDPRFDRADEKPFRAHGNTFDACVGDFNRDGRFDLLITEITHAWAGDSSDRTRILLQEPADPTECSSLSDRYATEADQPPFGRRFVSDPGCSLDRIPDDASVHNWNQGDLFGQFADFDLDGRLDVLISSGDYPDNQRLRVWHQLEDGRLVDVTSWAGLNNDGSQQISLGDIDLDGDVDILVGQSFFRYGAADKAGRTPSLKVYLNQAIERGRHRSLTLLFTGDPQRGVHRDALGAIARVEADLDGDGPGAVITQIGQLVGIGGHAGKQMAFELCFGLGLADHAERVTIWWPGQSEPSVLEHVAPGRHVVQVGR